MYSMNNFAVMGQYEAASLDDGTMATTSTRRSGMSVVPTPWATTCCMRVMAWVIIDPDGSSDEDYNAFTVAGVHSLSKRTNVYAGYSSADCDVGGNMVSGNDWNTLRVAMLTSDGGDNSLFSVGMNHKF